MADFLQMMGFSTVPTFNAPADTTPQKVSLRPDALVCLRLSNPWLTDPKGHHDFVLRPVQLTQLHPDAFPQTRACHLSQRGRQILRARYRANQLQAIHSYCGPGRTPFPPNEAPDTPDHATRLRHPTTPLACPRPMLR